MSQTKNCRYNSNWTRKENPEAIRDGLHDLHIKVEDLSNEMSLIKKMIEDQNAKNC